MTIVTLRPATPDDAPLMAAWDREPHVIAAVSDDAGAEVAFDDRDWLMELQQQSDVSRLYVGEVDGRPVGVMQIIDPYLEPTRYWGDVAPNLRAVDIWIGNSDDLGRGYGERMMRLALALCFADPAVTDVLIDPLNSNIRAHKFYRRLGFQVVGRQTFGDDDCLVHILPRDAWQAR